MRMRTAAVAAAVLALAACGGGGGKRLRRDAYVTRADAICTQLAKQRKTLTTPASLPAIPPYIDKALPYLDAALKELRGLRPPSELQAQVDELLKAGTDERKLFADLRSAAAKGNSVVVAQLGSKAVALNDRRKSLAGALGLTACANL
jgi:hypothetical protein